jgi:hypothetical protein
MADQTTWREAFAALATAIGRLDDDTWGNVGRRSGALSYLRGAVDGAEFTAGGMLSAAASIERFFDQYAEQTPAQYAQIAQQNAARIPIPDSANVPPSLRDQARPAGNSGSR